MSTLSTTNLKHPSSGSNNIVLNTDGTTTIAAPSNIIKSGIAVASTSGTAIDFTGIPSWVKRVTVMVTNGLSTNGSSIVEVRLGTTGGVQATGYNCVSSVVTGSNATQVTSSSTGAILYGASPAITRVGNVIFTQLTGNTWSYFGITGDTTSPGTGTCAGVVTLAGTLDRIRITTVNGTDTFDAGTINLLWEG